MIGRLLILMATVAPPVQVEIDGLGLPEAELQQLHGQLLTRLVEEGQAIGRPGVVTLRLVGGAEAVRVEVQHGRRVLARTVRGEGAVLRLAVTHAALELLEEVRTDPAGPDPTLVAEAERTLVVEATAEAEVLLPGAITAAITAGMVVARQAEHGRRLCLSLDDRGEPRLGMAALDEPCEARRPVVALERDVGELLAITPWSAVAGGPPEDRPEPGGADEGDEADPPRVGPQAEPAPSAGLVEAPDEPGPAEPRPTAWTVAPGVGAGVQARLRAAEAALLVDLVLRHRKGPVGWLRATYAPSRGGGLRANDAFVAAGAGWRLTASPRVALQGGLLAGVAVHGYAFEADRGARVDLDLELPLEVAIAVGRSVELGVLPLVGWTSRSRSHVAGGQTLWSRDRWRLGAAVGLRVAVPIVGNSGRRRRP